MGPDGDEREGMELRLAATGELVAGRLLLSLGGRGACEEGRDVRGGRGDSSRGSVSLIIFCLDCSHLR